MHAHTHARATYNRVRFDGVFRETRIWLNGVLVRDHAAFPGDANGEKGGAGMGGGYTSFNARLDNVSSILYGESAENVLTVYVDPRAGSGWFYEGGGIYRKTWLHSASPIHIQQDGVFATTHVATTPAPRQAPSLGSTAASATISVVSTMENTATASDGVAMLTYSLLDAGGAIVVGSTATASVKLVAAKDAATPATSTAAAVSIAVANAELWSVARPYLYTLQVKTDAGDAINVSVGIYNTKWTGDQGFYMNDEKIKIRGFCNHESFGGQVCVCVCGGGGRARGDRRCRGGSALRGALLDHHDQDGARRRWIFVVIARPGNALKFRARPAPSGRHVRAVCALHAFRACIAIL